MDSHYGMEFIADTISHINLLAEKRPIILHTDFLKIINAGRLQKQLHKHLPKEVLCYLAQNLKSSHIFIPTFDYSFCESGVYDVNSTNTDCGSLSKEAITCFSRYRTLVPVFSHVDLTGKSEFISKPLSQISAFGQNSFYDWFTKEEGYIFFWGCSLSTSNTYMHHVEATCDVSYRYSKTFNGEICGDDLRATRVKFNYFVRPRVVDLNYLDQGHSILKDNNSLLEEHDLLLEGFNTVSFMSCISKEIQRDEFVLLNNKTRLDLNPFFQSSSSPNFESPDLNKYKVISDINFELLFREQYAKFNCKVDFEYTSNVCLCLDELLEDSPFDCDLLILPSFNSIGLGRLSCIIDHSETSTRLNQFYDSLLEKLRLIKAKNSRLNICCSFINSTRDFREFIASDDCGNLWIQEMINSRSRFFKKSNEFDITPLQELVPIVQTTNIFCALNDLRFRYPYTLAFNGILAETFNHMVSNLSVPVTKKIISVDLDNTLWSGIAGDEDVSISSDYPENTHLCLQEALLVLKNRGFILAIISKNEELTVKRTFEKIESKMLIQYSDFSYIAASWNDKSHSLKLIAEHFNVDVSSIVHIDDSLFECNEIRSELPKNLILQFKPLEINNIVHRLLTSRQFLKNNTDIVSVEQRLEQLSTYKYLRDESNSASNKLSYLHSLCIEIRLDTGDEVTSTDRIYQLSSKTNQFLNHHIRPSRAEIIKMQKSHNLFSISYIDNISLEEICGLVTFERLESHSIVITHFTLSCRFFSRGIEYAALKILCDKFNLKKLLIDLCPLSRNNKFLEYIQTISDVNPDQLTSSNKPSRHELDVDKIHSRALEYINIYKTCR